ncbi:MAG TPA: FtsX-like permease family protein [Acidimicrobiales bacterium]|nr:FtsX-like permease family protein [Acidimicrobiales bacterium]
MSAFTLDSKAPSTPKSLHHGSGGLPARRAVTRWAWRLFRREWRQQLLVLGLIVVAVAASIVGATVATNSPQPANFGFGTAQDAFSISGSEPHLAAQIAALEHRFGKTEVIAQTTEPIPGSISTYQLTAENPTGPYVKPMLALVSGRFPATADQVALTAGLASQFGLHVDSTWDMTGVARQVTGIVEDPESLLDEFALVLPGRVTAPSQVTVLFDAPGVKPSAIGPNVTTPASVANSNPLNPKTVSLAVLTIGMLLIALVGVGGFTVLAQRRLRSLGLLAALGGTDQQARWVVRANGVVVGVVGAFGGTVLGFVTWLLYRPQLESSSHHLIGLWALPWSVVGVAVVLAIVATYLSASRPARAVTRVPIVTALSGRPAPPRQIHRSAIPGIVCFILAFILLGIAGANAGRPSGNGAAPQLVLGIVLLVPGVVLMAPFFLAALAKLGGHTTVAVRLALRDLARYRARSGSALAAISLSVMIAVIVAIAAAARYGNVLDYAGPNVASNQLIVYLPGGSPGGGANPVPAGRLRTMTATAQAIGSALGTHQVIALETTNAQINGKQGGRQYTGPFYLATPQLLTAFGIKSSQIDPEADIMSMRPGFSGISNLTIEYAPVSPNPIKVGPGGGSPPASPGQGPNSSPGPNGSAASSSACNAANYCLADPVIQEVGALPSGTSAPNTLLTEHALHALDLQSSVQLQGWLIQAAPPITALQLHQAQAAAAAAGMSVESKNDQPTSSEVIDWATVFGVALALCILAMSVGLIRSETASDLRVLAATGASSTTRRILAAATAGGLGLLGAVLGTLAGYIGLIGWIRSSSLNGGISALANVPVDNLLVILVGIPLAAVAVGWLLAGREPSAIAHQPIE